MIDTDDLPPALAEAAATAWRYILDHPDQAALDALQNQLHREPAVCRQLPRLLACSPFIAGLLRRQPQLLTELIASGLLQRSLAETELRSQLARLLAEPLAELGPTLRRFRQYQMLRIIWRDFSRLADTLETVRDTSLLAEACIELAQSQLQTQLEARFGVPRGRHSGAAQQLIVVAMGKLGARELNVSSDIDLIFAFPEAGVTDGERSISNSEFFIKLGQGLITALDQVTVEGFVFRVDMRLRPYGESGALALNFSAIEEYYQDQGRDWERYAMIKARPITGDPARGAELTATLRPFVFRRYVDFGVIDSLRGMKQMINGEVRRRGLQNDVKLGHGGIREVEFIAQCFQLIRGGRDLGLQQRELLQVLQECAALGCLPEATVAELRRAYLFLRDSEHAIQGYADQQSQALPSEPLQQAALAEVMGLPDWDGYLAELDGHRQRVAAHFRDLIAAPEELDDTPQELALWGEDLDQEALSRLGFQDPAASLEQLQALQQSPRVATLQAEGRERLQQFMPRLLSGCAEAGDPDRTLRRILPLVTAVLRRSAYLAMLLENPPALGELVLLCDASPWIAEQLARHPVLLDELLDRASLYTAPDKALLAAELRQQVARLPPGDLEVQMDALRYFKASHVLRVAASELVGRLPLMQVSDKLTWIAEVILEQVLAVAWTDLTGRFGEPERDSDGYGFAIFAYGKLGGIELSYSSDLDLVFVYDAAAQGVTDGARSIDNVKFYTRLGQRVIHILESRMALGLLYEVDMRLRPSGASGLLVSSLSGFASYQRETAWTWEHQALVRARLVAGDVAVGAGVDALRRDILCRTRDEAALAAEVVAMRRRMREQLLPASARADAEFDLKQSPGGIVDIEFMVQYAVLAWSHRVPELTRWSDNIRILETLAREGLFEQHESQALIDAYLAFRSAAHQLALQQRPGTVPPGEYRESRAAVSALWQRFFAAYDDSNPQAGETGVEK
ncbi:bifunctional [glutamate--ammonia ligase]-adenylyl-L-tyrosine phosphorylase/[glutamate--ammonia-ligase] adenylyltransferase [Kineobactrum salinum]|uniref:Bifunctional glutamine synthetase adenylyltransferase/adenylyl-removing enzyme n=1 Tax=Kineobactrum salinum TaxID=2708301 RepID=A0A6C0U2L6_9GAMM|nr:bifunctional [glutamate--ammonia ligase]-adenylyl-L-tyrosine phosphorylase/[glutamate--ammonia-ligase] adenylyltransferase [Kineobactrum salinum]QIB65699.1 bifunctional [glutamate--ammonia ligase]-adenylyl-L-tyrosine phosphorylase/[glutamate--ammonia-ligase] adenylyltransferase [Kineobactrum salinum]